MSSDASPRTKEPTTAEPQVEDLPAARSERDSGSSAAGPEPATTTEGDQPAAEPDPAEPEAAKITGSGDPADAEAADEAGDVPGEPGEPEDPPGRFAAALDRAWDNRIVRVGLFAAIVIGVLAVWSSHDSVSDSTRRNAIQDASVNARPPDEADIARIGSVAGCNPKLTVQNTQYKQAVCITAVSRLTITTFQTDTQQKAWLADAIPYGGAYLIGKRWVVGANDTAGMNKIADALGGTIADHSKDHN